MLISTCTREGKSPKSLAKLISYVEAHENFDLVYEVYPNAESIYTGHLGNIMSMFGNSAFTNSNVLNSNIYDKEVVILCHDDVEILSDPATLCYYEELAKKPETGFIGVAGTTLLRKNESWWSARAFNATRGFVFQGQDNTFMTPNYFGPFGQVVALDGCFLMASIGTLKKVGMAKPDYLSSDWDFYDMHWTYSAHRLGLNNYAAPILIRHESNGEMRKEWFLAKDQFNQKFYSELPCKLNMEKTHGLPI